MPNPSSPPVFAAPRGPALDALGPHAGVLNSALVIPAAPGWHVKRALHDLRRALPAAAATLAGAGESISARARFDLVVVVGEVARHHVGLARRVNARLLAQYNATGYFAGSAVLASPTAWRRTILAASLRRTVALPAVYLLGSACRGYSRLCQSLPRRARLQLSCLLCGRAGPAPMHWAPAGRPPYVRCPACGLVQRPSYRGAEQAYEDPQQQRDYLETRKDPVTRFRQERMLAGIERWIRRGRILDIGCADGRFLEVAADAGWQVEGVETSSLFARHAEALVGAVVHVGTLESAAFSGDRFDAVNLSHVIEHLADPPGHLSEIRRILKNRGVLAVSTPNASSFAALVQRERWAPAAYEPHVALFGPRQLVRLLRDAGFQVIEVRTQALGRILGSLWTSALFNAAPAFLRRRIEPREPQLNEYLGTVGMGEELFAVARK